MASNLRDKTDAECRSLAGTYLTQRNKARSDLEKAQARIRELEAETLRLKNLAAEMVE